MRITFILPMYLAAPAGGFKVVYEYANRLQRRGHQVTLVHPRNCVPQTGLGELLKSALWPWKLRLTQRPLLPWFPLERGVQFKLVTDLREWFIPAGEVIVATAFNTAAHVANYSARQGRKFYLIQGYESWQGDEQAVRASWQLPLQKIVVSRWLLDKAAALGEAARTVLIPIGIDVTQFKLLTPPVERNPATVAMLYHPAVNKGAADGCAALTQARASIPHLQATLFGTTPRPAHLPNWCAYVERPTGAALTALYNQSAIFLSPSHSEGWGLPALESQACGCALISADNGGIHEFAVAEQTALIVPAQRPDVMAAQIMRLVNDDALRQRLALAGHARAQAFDFNTSVDSFETLLSGKSEQGA